MVMEEPQIEPLTLCLENTSGEEVSIQIESNDNFQMFLDKAKALLGFDIDLNSITNNQPVLLTDNIYQFLINAEQNIPNNDLVAENFDREPEGNANDDLVYVLDDGTEIKASQIHFDNEDPVELRADDIPFVKYADDSGDENKEKSTSPETIKKINIVDSPVLSPNSCTKMSFVNNLPFKLVCNNTSNFEAQFTKYLESSVKNKNVLDATDNCDDLKTTKNRNDEFNLTREDILNMFKDAPVTSAPYEEKSFSDKRKHVRKTDPSRLHKTSKPLSCIVDSHSQLCFICRKFVDSSLEKLYLFDNEDQKLHRCSPQRKYSTQLKILCEQCLAENFKPCTMKSPSQSLKPDEYLIIKNNQQYIFQKISPIDLKECDDYIDKANDESNSFMDLNDKQSMDFVKIEIGSDGEIVTKSLYDEPSSSDDVVIVKDDVKDSSSDVEIIEPVMDDNVIENLDDVDEQVKEFLGTYQCDNDWSELKCRFCDRIFENISEVLDHGEEHTHDLDDGPVFPCPLCDYGYANLKWLKGHLKAAHDKPKSEEKDIEKDTENDAEIKEENSSPVHSPVAKRTRSAIKKNDSQKDKEDTEKTTEDSTNQDVDQGPEPHIVIKMEVKQEVLNSSDEEIWILQTGEDEATADCLQQMLQGVKIKKEDETTTKVHSCVNCSQSFTSTSGLLEHKCGRRRGRKRKTNDQLCVPTKEDFYKRAQGRLKKVLEGNDLLAERTRKKRNRQPTSDPQIVTCHDCNESFTSKVRLKFHMQFHGVTPFLSPSGEYQCGECGDAQFPTESELFDHVHFQHDKQKRWQCPVKDCGKTFFLRATLTKHSRTHTDTRRYGCTTCGKRFLDKQTLDEHGVTHLQIKPFQCHICLKQLTRRSRLRMHLRAHEEELRPKLVLVCAICSRAFRDHVEAQEHITKSPECVVIFAGELKEESEEGVSEQLSPTSGVVRLTVKAAESPRISKLIDREVVDAEGEALLSELDDFAKPIIRVVRIEKAFRCEYCEDVFYQEDSLNSHRIIHKGVKNPFTCHICKVTFATYSRCTTHKTTHGFYKRSLADAKKKCDNPQPEAGPSATGILGYGGFPVVKHFLCEDCGRSYLHWTYLQVHRRMKHANENFIFKCNLCDSTFPNSWSVTYHRKKVHGKTGQDDGGITKIAREDYRIPCRDCDEILPNKTALYKHRQKEHSDESLFVNSDENNINTTRTACFKCGHNFSQPQDLQKHLVAVHGHESSSMHACTLCPRVFRSAPSRDRHMRAHGTERPFPCDVCGVTFTRSTAMRNHRLIHSGVRAWVCSYCPKRFRVRSELRAHIRLKHPAHLVVIEMEGLNPSTEEVVSQLRINNIDSDKVLEISIMSFAKGTSSVIPHSSRAFSMLDSVPRTQVLSWRSADTPDLPPALQDRPLDRRSHTLEDIHQNQIGYLVTNAGNEEALSLNAQLMLNDGGLMNASEMVHLDNILLG